MLRRAVLGRGRGQIWADREGGAADDALRVGDGASVPGLPQPSGWLPGWNAAGVCQEGAWPQHCALDQDWWAWLETRPDFPAGAGPEERK